MLNDLIIVKQCRKCKEIKIFSEFVKLKRNKDGLHSYCKICHKEKNKKYINPEKIRKASLRYHHKNKDKLNEKTRIYRKNNPEKLKEQRKIQNQKHKLKNREREQNRIKTDPLFKLKKRLRTRLYKCLQSKKWIKNNTFKNYIGCSLNELKTYIENKFVFNMNWENQGEWHIDHIIPLSSAKNEYELYKLCHYTNLQPLWAIDNLKKKDSIWQVVV